MWGLGVILLLGFFCCLFVLVFLFVYLLLTVQLFDQK